MPSILKVERADGETVTVRCQLKHDCEKAVQCLRVYGDKDWSVTYAWRADRVHEVKRPQRPR